METLPVDLTAQIVGLVSRRSKERLRLTDSSWQPIVKVFHEGEFDLFIDLHVNSAAPSIECDVSKKDLLSGSRSAWSEEVAKDTHLVRDVHLSISNNFKWKQQSHDQALEEDFRFIQKVFALARRGRRVHLTLKVQSNGADPPKQCEILRRLFDLIPCIPVATVDRHNALRRDSATEKAKRTYDVYDLLESTFDRLRIPFMPELVHTLLELSDKDKPPTSQADPYLEKYYFRYFPKCTDPLARPRYNGPTTFATFLDMDTVLIDFSAFRRYQKTNKSRQKRSLKGMFRYDARNYLIMAFIAFVVFLVFFQYPTFKKYLLSWV
uniref:F-box domain-containing protein n=1 Tax=Steinernema glaseri TaxID=37863 RepID=A0A1I7Z392_9BILA